MIKYVAAMSFAFKEELNELVIFRRCCSAANLWVIILSRLAIVEGADILHEPHGSNTGGLEARAPWAPWSRRHWAKVIANPKGSNSVNGNQHFRPLIISHLNDIANLFLVMLSFIYLIWSLYKTTQSKKKKRLKSLLDATLMPLTGYAMDGNGTK